MITSLLRKFTSFGSTKMVIIVRTDLKMGRGKLASQAAHAAILLYQSSLEKSEPHLKWWLSMGQPKIILKVETGCEKVLREIAHKAEENDLNVCVVRDAGRTQVETGTLTAVGIGPNRGEEIDKITGDLKLL
ncbi:hypothetical protein JTB14_005448 [Gonioctena quinquepunctata]|nr:hypothetical protein JTB14_005448 [Gonioctena quinquepunctata]